MLIQPDYTESQDDLTPGEYFVRITGCEQKTSKAGSPYLRWELSTFNESEAKNNDRKVWYTTMLSGKGAGMLKKFVKVATGEDISDAFDTDMLVGRELKAVVAEDDQGYTNVKAIKPIQ